MGRNIPLPCFIKLSNILIHFTETSKDNIFHSDSLILDNNWTKKCLKTF